jgi:hypothetical protein
LWWAQDQAFSVTLILGTRWPLLNATYPLYLAQNTLTTGLIVWRIWTRYRLRTKAVAAAAATNGIVAHNPNNSALPMPSTNNAAALFTPSLVGIMWVIVESATVYTTAILVMLVLRAMDSHAQFVMMNCLLPPTIGACFRLPYYVFGESLW